MRAYLTRDSGNSKTFISFGVAPEMNENGEYSHDGDTENFFDVNLYKLDVPFSVYEREIREVEIIIKPTGDE